MEELESLMNSGIQIAGQMLQEHGGFVPYGLVLDTGGDSHTITPSEGSAEMSTEELLGLLVDRLRGEVAEGGLKATALFAGVTIQPEEGSETEAVMVGLEHREGDSLNVFFPYTQTAEGELEVGELFAEDREAELF